MHVSKEKSALIISLEGPQGLAFLALERICCWHFCLPTPTGQLPGLLPGIGPLKTPTSDLSGAATAGALKAVPFLCPLHPLGLEVRHMAVDTLSCELCQ